MTDAIPAGPRVPRREVWVDLPAEYAGLRLRVWVNAPSRLWAEIQSGDEARARAVITQIVLEHNGWLDFDGAPFPAATDPAFWDQMSQELAGVVMTAVQLEMTRLPKSMVPQKRR